MAIALVQGNTASAGTGTTVEVSLPAAATADNFLVSCMSADKDAGSAPSPSVGWTSLSGHSSTSVSVAMAYKLADADASDTCTWSWTSSTFTSGAWIGEYSGIVGTLVTPVPKNDKFTDETNITSIAFSATANEDGLAVGMIGRDTGAAFTWTNFTERADFVSGTNSGLGVADLLTVTDAQAVSETVSTGSADQMSGVMALFGFESASEPPSLTAIQAPLLLVG